MSASLGPAYRPGKSGKVSANHGAPSSHCPQLMAPQGTSIVSDSHILYSDLDVAMVPQDISVIIGSHILMSRIPRSSNASNSLQLSSDLSRAEDIRAKNFPGLLENICDRMVPQSLTW